MLCSHLSLLKPCLCLSVSDCLTDTGHHVSFNLSECLSACVLLLLCVCVCVPLLVMVTLLCEPKCVYGQLKWWLYCYGCFVLLYCVYKTNNCAQCDIIFKSNYTEQRRARGEERWRDAQIHSLSLLCHCGIMNYFFGAVSSSCVVSESQSPVYIVIVLRLRGKREGERERERGGTAWSLDQHSLYIA